MFLSNIAKHFIATIQFQLSEIFVKIDKYFIRSEIMYKDSVEVCRSYTLQ